ncbi:hypothetical protein [Nonlabens sp.]|jgi:hypothetical protein|uniref:hypothetical protein n=1 Tax=Nonlabens sp. TaxID=1888209 RepID=UPI0039E2448D
MKNALSIISILLSGLLVYVFDKIYGDSIDWQIFKSFEIGKFLSVKLSLGKILIFTGLVVLIYFVGKKLFFTKKRNYSKKQNKLKQYNNSENAEKGILLRWRVYFDSYGEPFIADLNPFCTKHNGAPIRFMQGRCPLKDCENHNNYSYDENTTRNAIESNLIDRWKT